MLTICSVSYNSADYLNLNMKHMKERNSIPFKWLVYENGAEEVLLPEFTKFRGENNVEPDQKGFVNSASSNHAAGLNFLLARVQTKYALLLDPDFYITYPLSSVLKTMEEQGLWFFGAPYMPEAGKNRIQNFPVAFCMLIDMSKTSLTDLDFTPSNKSGDFIRDTGFFVYNYFKGLDLYEIAVPSAPYTEKVQTTTQRLGKKNPNRFDEYYYQGQLFGIHAHMKLHLRKDYDLKHRKEWQLQAIKDIINDKTI